MLRFGYAKYERVINLATLGSDISISASGDETGEGFDQSAASGNEGAKWRNCGGAAVSAQRDRIAVPART